MKRSCLLACVVLAVAVPVAACSSDATKSNGTTTTSPVVAPTVTTVPAAATTVAPATTISIPEGGFGEPTPADDGPSAWDSGAAKENTVIAALGDCEPFHERVRLGAPPGLQRCGVWNAIGGQRMWTVTELLSDQLVALVWQQSVSNTWVPMLAALEPGDPNTWSDISIITANIDSGPNDELVVGVRLAGTGDYLDLTVIDIRSDAPTVVAVYNGISNGTAVLREGEGVEFWNGVYADGDPGCCPSSFQRFTMFATDLGDWLVVAGPSVPTGDPAIPPTQF